MFERFTVDLLAENVHTQLLEGDPTSKLTHKFFRKGRRDGKKGHDPASVEKLLVDAVHLAGSTLAEELTNKVSAVEQRIADGEAAIQRFATLTSAATPTGLEQPSMPAQPLPTVAVADPQDSAQLLARAAEDRRRLSAQREARAREADRRSREKSRADKFEAAEASSVEAHGEINRLKRERASLPAEYLQRFESIKHTGEMLWSRYCNGFVQGQARRGSRSSDVEPPGGTLSFQTPSALASVVNGVAAEGRATDGDV